MTSQCYEAFAMTIAEAYSYGVPVIAGRVGNMEGMVKEGITGVKFQYDSAEDLARKVQEFENMDMAALKENAREFYQNRLRPEDNYQKLMEIYESISDKNSIV
jgi:glycosyltransferase involved in cell wall biosynthesis